MQVEVHCAIEQKTSSHAENGNHPNSALVHLLLRGLTGAGVEESTLASGL